MTPPVRTRAARPRRGTAIVAALALVTLAAALLASAAAIVTAGAHATLVSRAALAAESGARRALARDVMTWSAELDSLAEGESVERALDAPADEQSADLPATGRRRTQRLRGTLFALSVEVRVGTVPTLAVRRMRLLVQRGLADSSGVAAPPGPIARWSTADLY